MASVPCSLPCYHPAGPEHTVSSWLPCCARAPAVLQALLQALRGSWTVGDRFWGQPLGHLPWVTSPHGADTALEWVNEALLPAIRAVESIPGLTSCKPCSCIYSVERTSTAAASRAEMHGVVQKSSLQVQICSHAGRGCPAPHTDAVLCSPLPGWPFPRLPLSSGNVLCQQQWGISLCMQQAESYKI